jgi:(p)ppGpp synthase/HD superfamily hydrolase
MTPKERIKLAEKYAKHYHMGQFRKVDGKPFHTHPKHVVEILQRYGYKDPVTICIAYLHDTIEDTPLIMDELQEIFGYEISNGVFVLSKNKGKVFSGKKLNEEEYKQRLSFARNKIQRVKIADMIDNTKDLIDLPKEYVERKVKDAEEFYIQMGKEVAPLMVKELIRNIKSYKNKVENNNS